MGVLGAGAELGSSRRAELAALASLVPCFVPAL